MDNRVFTRREVRAIRWEYGGIDFSFDDLVRLSGFPVNLLQERLMKAWDVESAVTTQPRRWIHHEMAEQGAMLS